MSSASSSSQPFSSSKTRGKMVRARCAEDEDDDDNDSRPMHAPFRPAGERDAPAASKQRSADNLSPVSDSTVAALSTPGFPSSSKKATGYGTTGKSAGTGFTPFAAASATNREDGKTRRSRLRSDGQGRKMKADPPTIGIVPADTRTTSSSSQSDQERKERMKHLSSLQLADASYESFPPSMLDNPQRIVDQNVNITHSSAESRNKFERSLQPAEESESESEFPTSSIVSTVLSETSIDHGDNAMNENDHPALRGPVVAELVQNEDDIAERLNQQFEEKLDQKVAERLANERRQQITVDAVAIDEGKLRYLNGIEGRDPEFLVDANDDERRGKILGCDRRTFILTALLIAVLAAAGAATGIALTNGGGGITTKAPNPTASPTTPSPALSPTQLTTPEFDVLLALIGTTISNDTETLTNPDTVQYQALDWLANTDEYNAANMPGQVLVERYALAVVYLSTEGDTWKMQHSFLSESSVCLWGDPVIVAGVVCDADNLYVIQLQLSDNNVRGEMPSEIGLLSNLKTLDTSHNPLFGPIPMALFRLTNLETTFLGDCFLTGTVPTEVGMLGQLNLLSIGRNALEGTLPIELGLLTSLMHLDVDSCGLSGPIPSEVGNLSLMESLNMRFNVFNGTIPTQLGLLSNLRSWDTSHNQLFGTIPMELFQLTNLETTFLGDCSLTGTIPTEVGMMGQLNTLLMRRNDFEGTLPTELGLLTGLVELDVVESGLSGPIPTEFGLLTSMSYLYLSYNQLSGPLPNELGQLIVLTYLEVNGNRLTGTVPKEYGNLTNLEVLFLHQNNLTGNVDPIFCQASNRPSPTLTLSADCWVNPVSEIVCSCCYYCCADGSDCV